MSNVIFTNKLIYIFKLSHNILQYVKISFIFFNLGRNYVDKCKKRLNEVMSIEVRNTTHSNVISK